MVSKRHILDEIRRTAEANAGVPLGRQRFFAETGIREGDWSGRFWVRWSDAVREAGYEPNSLNERLPDDKVLEHLALLVRELGHFPVKSELVMQARSDADFPSHNTFARFGPKATLAWKLLDHARRRGYEDVAQICVPLAVEPSDDESSIEPKPEDMGFVYLLKSGRYYKVGRTNAAGRRERELAIQLPERARLVHTIKTDDPLGIEAYWHRRFADRRKNGEWFQLTAADVSAFRRRKFM